MDLAKHIPGKPLTPAEHAQRKNAARARWGLAAAATATGGLAGGLTGGARRAILTQNQAAAATRLAGLVAAEQMASADRALQARAAARRAGIDAAIHFRMRVNPETGAERQQRLRDLLNRTPSAAPAPADRPPVIGSPENLRIYDYELEQARRKLKPAESHLADMKRREQAGADVAHRDLRAQQVRVDRMKREITALEDLKDLAPKTIGRAGSTQQRRGQDVQQPATVERKFRRGETQAQIRRRITEAKRVLRSRHATLLQTLERRTEQLRVAARDRALTEAETAIRDAYSRARYGRAVLRGAGKGGLIGAGLGLTVAGIGLLAHHVAKTTHQKRRLAKMTEEDPEASIGRGMAETFRAWIDRLLGKTTTPLNMGDTVAAAIAPGITQAFANGAAQPPLEQPPPGSPWHIVVDFDQLNPSVRRHMASYALDRIVAITAEQREAIRSIMMQNTVLQGIGPLDVARMIRETIGLTAYQMGVVRGYRTELEQLDPAALERKLRDARYDRTVRRAIETNTPLKPEQIDAMVEAYHRRMLAFRAETIARTESIRATSYGAVARAQDVLDQYPDLDVVKRWIATDDERTRHTHRELDGEEVQGMETPFRTVAGNLIRWPCDSEAAADEVIKCRCSLAFRFIPKQSQTSSNFVAEAV
jgi:hypothetical protein